MRIDLANFNIQMVRSNLLAQSVEYEKTKFADALALQGGLGICDASEGSIIKNYFQGS